MTTRKMLEKLKQRLPESQILSDLAHLMRKDHLAELLCDISNRHELGLIIRNEDEGFSIEEVKE